MYLKMQVKKRRIHYSVFMDYFPALVVSVTGEQMTKAQHSKNSAGWKAHLKASIPEILCRIT